MPYVVGYELFNLRLPSRLQIVVSYVLDFIHETFNILNKDVVTSYQDPFLLVCRLLGNCSALSRILTLIRCLRVWGLRLCAPGYVWIFYSRHALSALRWLRTISILFSSLTCTGACNRAIGLLSLFDIFLLFLFLLSSFILLLLLVLLVSRKWEVHLHLDLRSCACDGSLEDLIGEQDLIEKFVVRSGWHEVLVVDIRILGGIDTNVLATPLIFCYCFSCIFFVSKSWGSLHWLN